MKDLIFFFIGMGFIEGFLKPLSILSFKRVVNLLPEMFDRLDPIMPSMVADLTAEEMRSKIMHAMDTISADKGQALTERDKRLLFEEFIRRYDPTIAADKLKRNG